MYQRRPNSIQISRYISSIFNNCWLLGSLTLPFHSLRSCSILNQIPDTTWAITDPLQGSLQVGGSSEGSWHRSCPLTPSWSCSLTPSWSFLSLLTNHPHYPEGLFFQSLLLAPQGMTFLLGFWWHSLDWKLRESRDLRDSGDWDLLSAPTGFDGVTSAVASFSTLLGALRLLLTLTVGPLYRFG